MTRLTVTAPADKGAAGDGDPQTRQERVGIIVPGRVLTSRISYYTYQVRIATMATR